MFDFDQEVDRSGTMSLKWDKYKGQDVLPMWVADTDFVSPPSVIEALTKRVAHGIFGYSRPSPRLIELIIERMATRYGWAIEPEWLVFLPGVVPERPTFWMMNATASGRPIATPASTWLASR